MSVGMGMGYGGGMLYGVDIISWRGITYHVPIVGMIVMLFSDLLIPM